MSLSFYISSPPLLASGEDPYLWLEDIDGDKALTWVKAQNRESQAALEATEAFEKTRNRLHDIYTSDARIPHAAQRGPWMYNFWRDEKNKRGLWRRTSAKDYENPEPNWETVLDLDKLAKQENENWVWKGSECLHPSYRRCLIKLSRGGADAHVIREFDTRTKAFVPRGFQLNEAKHEVSWHDENTLLIASDFGKGSLTTSGYPRIVKQWVRGTPISKAPVVYSAKVTDVGVGIGAFRHEGVTRELIQRAITFYEYEFFLRSGDHLAKLRVPEDADVSLLQDQLLLRLRTGWSIAGRDFTGGSLLTIPLVSFIEGQRDFRILFAPNATVSLDGFSQTKNGLLLNLLDKVRGRVRVLRLIDGRWVKRDLDVPRFGKSQAWAMNGEQSDDYYLSVQSFLSPSQLLGGNLGTADQRFLKSQPSFFDASGLQIKQHEVASNDGTRVPYFLVARTDIELDGRNPTILYGYGGFEIPLTAGYSPGTGAAWLEKGGVFAVANIRGGGEFGPAWHQAAIKQNRQRAYDDFVSVAKDLIKRKITSPRHLGIRGGSNGGLLVGVSMTQRPDLFGAVVCQVPLLDMKRFHKLLAGASWMSEYGDPDDPADWTYISKYSPYQNLRPGIRYPTTLITTSTRDDRVHPGHARKFTARLKSLNQEVLYYENIEGGHGGAANLDQKAYMDAMAFSFFWNTLAAE